MNIAVCVKQSIDTEAVITLDAQGRAITEGAALIIDPYAEFALEKAVQLKEEHGGEVVVVTIGSQDNIPTIRHALSMGADRAILVDDEDIDQENPRTKAQVLACVLKTLKPDLIMGGCKSGDTQRGQTLGRVAVLMDLPQSNLVVDAHLEGNGVAVSREIEDGVEQIMLSMPCVLAVQQGLAQPRYPNVRSIMLSKKKPIETTNIASLGLDMALVGKPAAQVEVVSYALAPKREGGRIIEGELPDVIKETTSLLATQAKVI